MLTTSIASTRFLRGVCAACSLVLLAACGRDVPDAAMSRPLTVQLDTSSGVQTARIVVRGFGARELEALRSPSWDAGKWPALVHVAAATSDSAAVPGTYMVSDSAVEFHPAPPLQRGVDYSVRVDASKLVVPRKDSVRVTTVSLPAAAKARVAEVVVLSPHAAEVPENLRRIFVQFSMPMSTRPLGDVVHLIDASGRAIPDAFAAEDAASWNVDRTALTLALRNAPGGGVLRAGRPYALVIDSAWKTMSGASLVKPGRVEFRAGPAVSGAMPLASWTIRAPRAGTRDPLVVAAPRTLDRKSMEGGIDVVAGTTSVSGAAVIDSSERSWRFTPRDVWRAGEYTLTVSGRVEDLAGNGVIVGNPAGARSDSKRQFSVR